MYQHKDVVRRAADIRVVSRSSFVDSLLEAPFDKPFGRLMIPSKSRDSRP